MKDPHEIINNLSPSDALTVLRILAHDDKRLAARIAEIATAHLSDIDPEDVAFMLYEELNFLEVELEVLSYWRARKRYGQAKTAITPVVSTKTTPAASPCPLRVPACDPSG